MITEKFYWETQKEKSFDANAIINLFTHMLETVVSSIETVRMHDITHPCCIVCDVSGQSDTPQVLDQGQFLPQQCPLTQRTNQHVRRSRRHKVLLLLQCCHHPVVRHTNPDGTLEARGATRLAELIDLETTRKNGVSHCFGVHFMAAGLCRNLQFFMMELFLQWPFIYPPIWSHLTSIAA